MGTDNVKRLLFFWVGSGATATLGYYLLWLIMPRHYVFGAWPRMLLYHYQHPLQYLLIPCFFYGIMATLLADRFYRQKTPGRLVITLLIAALTILLSSPVGGMLWHWHDMQAGYFPDHWQGHLVGNGVAMGLSIGWLIVGLSVPYSWLGLGVCFGLTRLGAGLFRVQDNPLTGPHR